MSMMKLPLQAPSIDRDFRNQVAELAAAGGDAQPSGFLDILGSVAKAALPVILESIG